MQGADKTQRAVITKEVCAQEGLSTTVLQYVCSLPYLLVWIHSQLHTVKCAGPLQKHRTKTGEYAKNMGRKNDAECHDLGLFLYLSESHWCCAAGSALAKHHWRTNTIRMIQNNQQGLWPNYIGNSFFALQWIAQVGVCQCGSQLLY